MNSFAVSFFLTGVLAASLTAQNLTERAFQMESAGDWRGARQSLEQAVKAAPGDLNALSAWAEFLDLRHDGEARRAYAQLLSAAQRSGDNRRASQAARRLAALELERGNRAAAAEHLRTYTSLGGTGLALPQDTDAQESGTLITIPGPLRSFARMAALSPDLPAEEVVGALARNVITNGYQASSGSEGLEQTEYLKLVIRYLAQARELERLSGSERVIKISACESTETNDLLKVLGFRMRGGCGSEVVLETVNASRAFLTMDSGFPLAELEQALRTNRPFIYDFTPARLPILYTSDYWLSAKERQSGEFIDAFLGDPALCRLYLGLSKLDPATADALQKSLPVQRIRAFAHVFDFFGGMFRLRDGKAVVPGGQRSASAWADLAGASPDQGLQFFEKLVARDDGWLASYFDALSRLEGPVLDYLTEPGRLKRFYAALRGRVTSPGPARPVFRSNTDLMLLTTRLRIEPNGQAHIPGGVEIWKNLFINHPHGKYDGKLTKSAAGWKEPDDVMEALFGLSRKAVENEPLKIFLALSDLEGRRLKPLEPATVDRLAREFRFYGSQYTIFTESPSLSDKTIIQYLNVADAISAIRDVSVRADSAGLMQALVGIWQVLCRHDLIQDSRADATLAALLTPFQTARSSRELFDAGRAGLTGLMAAAGAEGGDPQERLMSLMAGAANPADVESHGLLLADMAKVFEAQRLVSLKTIFDLQDHMEAVSKGEKLNTALVNRLTGRISDLSLPRAALSAQERNSFSFGFWTEKHIDQQRKLNLRASIEKAAGDAEKLRDLRGLLTPMLRDTLVGFLYVHYAPPGAQILYTNPLFARSHDFIGIQGANQTWRQTEVVGSGWPSSAGGRLVGSLSTLPYALAEAEQNFLIPNREQALIWGDLVPQLLASAKVPRWWNVKPVQLRFVGLHMRAGEAFLTEAAMNADKRAKAIDVLDRFAPPNRVRKVADALARGNAERALDLVTPSELFEIGAFAVNAKADIGNSAIEQIGALVRQNAQLCSKEAISNAFGTPKPTLSTSLRPGLMNLRTFPTLMGYSSRILAESWEGNILYYASLADELGLRPSQLNLLVPEWTQKTVEQIFATHLEDWPALLRSLRVTGDGVRAQTRKLMQVESTAGLN